VERMSIRAIRIPEEQWTRLQELARQEYTSTSATVRKAIAEYLARNLPSTPVPSEQDLLDLADFVSDEDWYNNHREPLHDGYMPNPGICSFCDRQTELRKNVHYR
jgi:Arc/MetJ-type ribon-helix-helix transcriptional regulator